MKVRSDVAAELHLKELCSTPSQLFAWDAQRLKRSVISLCGIPPAEAAMMPGVSSAEVDDRSRRKREAEVCGYCASSCFDTLRSSLWPHISTQLAN